MGLYDYEWFKSGFLSMSGIDLNSYKEGQMKRRIDNFLKKHQVDDYNTFLSLLRQDTEIHDSFITYLTINVSEFYRNPLQWQTLEKDIIPLLLKRFPKPLRIWSAACSTGDEPYSLAMVLSDSSIESSSDFGDGYGRGSFSKSKGGVLHRSEH